MQEGIPHRELQQTLSEGGCWLSACTLKQLLGAPRPKRAAAIGVYAILGGVESQGSYPAIQTIATLLGVSEELVWDCLEYLYDSKLINDSDVKAIHESLLR